MQIRLYAPALFVSAFLLFQVQPMIARFVLPWFGGGSGVWSCCLLFFQGILLIGYLYAHGLARLMPLRRQVVVHGLLLLASMLLLPITPDATLKPASVANPNGELLWLLIRTLGIPCILLSASAPLLQSWFAGGKAATFRLYAVSNFGSLLGLLAYPLVVEPRVGLGSQTKLWSTAYLLFVALSVASAVIAAREDVGVDSANTTSGASAPTTRLKLLWLAFAGLGVIRLLSISNQLSTNIAPVPLLWVLPLSLYLGSYVLCFWNASWYRRRLWLSLFCLAILPTLWLSTIPLVIGIQIAVLVSCGCLFFGCMVCHGELVQLKPDKQHLTSFYLYLALGGVLGGAFVTFAAPFLFSRFWELPIGLFGTFLFAGVCIARSHSHKRPRTNPLGLPQERQRATRIGMLVLWSLGTAAFAYLGCLPLSTPKGTIAAERSFYGRLSVLETRKSGERVRILAHGRTRHGLQRMSEQERRVPTMYYNAESGIGVALSIPLEKRHIGVIGLGTGTIAAYGRDGDRIRFYELDPTVTRLATRYFSFLDDTPAEVKVVHGDGRLSLERELASSGGNRFDVLAIDAFSSDNVPAHLLTREAFSLYGKHMKDDGVLAVHVTNAFLDLAPMVRAQAEALGKESLLVKTNATRETPAGSTWVLVASRATFLHQSALNLHTQPMPEAAYPVWTDDYNSLLQVLE